MQFGDIRKSFDAAGLKLNIVEVTICTYTKWQYLYIHEVTVSVRTRSDSICTYTKYSNVELRPLGKLQIYLHFSMSQS
jgi:hypothetical protein